MRVVLDGVPEYIEVGSNLGSFFPWECCYSLVLVPSHAVQATSGMSVAQVLAPKLHSLRSPVVSDSLLMFPESTGKSVRFCWDIRA